MTPEDIQQAIEKLRNFVINTSQFNEAKVYAYELLDVQEIQEDSTSLAKVYNLLGLAYKELSDYPKALVYLEKALLINEEIGSKDGISVNFGNIGNVYKNLSDYPKALEYLEKAVNINEEIGKKVGISANIHNIGIIYKDFSDYPKALEYLEKALLINEEIGNKGFLAKNLEGIGLVYINLSDYSKAIEYLEKALYVHEEINSKDGISENLLEIGLVYAELSEYPKALEYYNKSLQIAEEIGNKNDIAINLGNIGVVYAELFDYSKALEFYEKALFINEEIGNKDGISTNIMNIGNVYHYLSDYLKALEYFEKALLIDEDIGNKQGIAFCIGNIGKTFTSLEEYPKALEYLNTAYSLSIEIGTKNITKEMLKAYSNLYEKIGDIDTAFSYYKQYVEVKDEITSEETKKKATQFDQQRKIEEDRKARELRLARFQEQEKLLHNILPSTIADRILKQESFIADHFDSASVLFMDLVGFTTLASIAPPKQLVFLLDAIFQKADDLIEQFGLEKIKTIGDGYLAVANVTSPLEEHQKATAKAALQLLETMRDFTVNIPSDLGYTDWIKNMNDLEIRIGIHTGEVVAGIIGKNKYTYDLWGDAVNVASRMESNSEAGRIHISEQFAKSIEQHSEFKLIPRGEINIKGKGTMNTYWLEKAK